MPDETPITVVSPPGGSPTEWSLTDSQAPNGPASLASGAAHLWRIRLERPAAELVQFLATLSDDELSRAGRFTYPGLRERFIVGRGLLRAILSRYVELPPERIRFVYNNFGKPALDAPPAAASQMTFNLSHSGDWALLGVADGRQIGVDIERHRPETDCEQLAEHFFAAGEIATLARVPAEMRRKAFFSCWTRKEAYIKAVGRGLSTPLNGFEVSLDPAVPAALMSVAGAPQETGRWLLESLCPADGYSAAICIERPVCDLRQFGWD